MSEKQTLVGTGSGLHEANILESPEHQSDTVPEAVLGEPKAELAEAYIGSDGHVHELPPELRPGPDGKPPKLTEELMATLRRKYFTVRHVLLVDCGHKLDMINQPKNNCETCWYEFFNRHGKLVEVTHEFFTDHGKQPLVAMRGARYVKMFLRFMSTIHHMLEEQKALEAANGDRDKVGQSDTDVQREDRGEGCASKAVDAGRQTETGQVSDSVVQS
jgi:hypothetical protein